MKYTSLEHSIRSIMEASRREDIKAVARPEDDRKELENTPRAETPRESSEFTRMQEIQKKVIDEKKLPHVDEAKKKKIKGEEPENDMVTKIDTSPEIDQSPTTEENQPEKYTSDNRRIGSDGKPYKTSVYPTPPGKERNDRPDALQNRIFNNPKARRPSYTKADPELEKLFKESTVESKDQTNMLHGNQKKLDKNKNGRLDSDDFKKLRAEREEVEFTQAELDHFENISDSLEIVSTEKPVNKKFPGKKDDDGGAKDLVNKKSTLSTIPADDGGAKDLVNKKSTLSTIPADDGGAAKDPSGRGPGGGSTNQFFDRLKKQQTEENTNMEKINEEKPYFFNRPEVKKIISNLNKAKEKDNKNEPASATNTADTSAKKPEPASAKKPEPASAKRAADTSNNKLGANLLSPIPMAKQKVPLTRANVQSAPPERKVAATQVTKPETEKKPASSRPDLDSMSFGKAFAAARKTHGGAGGKFTWKGKDYQTNIKGEKYVSNPTQVKWGDSAKKPEPELKSVQPEAKPGDNEPGGLTAKDLKNYNPDKPFDTSPTPGSRPGGPGDAPVDIPKELETPKKKKQPISVTGYNSNPPPPLTNESSLISAFLKLQSIKSDNIFETAKKMRDPYADGTIGTFTKDGKDVISPTAPRVEPETTAPVPPARPTGKKLKDIGGTERTEEVEFSETELDHFNSVLEGRGRPKKSEDNPNTGSGRDPRQHIQVIAGQAAGGRNIEFTHNDNSKTTITPSMGRKIINHLEGLKPADRQIAVNKMHDSSSGLKM